MQRQFRRPIKRIVVKIGSSILSTYQLKPKAAILKSLVNQISDLHKEGKEIVIVSSGAIVLGMGALEENRRPTDVASLQARAAIGQNILMNTYSRLFHLKKLICAQILLTWDDFDNRLRFNNARNTLLAILEKKAIPIINENDTISTEEIKFGDNDRLSALVASLVNADLLIMLSDVEGFYDLRNGERKLFREITAVTKEIESLASGTGNKDVSRGGMTTKLEAVKIASQANIACIIAHGETPDVLTRIVHAEHVGTYFHEKENKLLARKHWIYFGVKPKGKIVVDDGAKAALLKGGKSLLLPGIVSWDGNFAKEDVVVVCDKNQEEIAKGITNYSVIDLHKIQDRKGKSEVIHCDNLVLSKDQ